MSAHPGDQPTEFTLYEDDGTTTAYQSGACRETPLSQSGEMPVHDSKAFVFIASLLATTYEISAASGSSIDFLLDAGLDNALRNYLLVAGVSGMSPGLPLPGGQATMPINWDWFSDLEMSLLNTVVFANFMGALDMYGAKNAQLNVPPLPPSSVGLKMHCAFCCNNPFDFVYNPIEVLIAP